ncbi:circadian clock protein KaiB [Taibaiella lutea]|uniref:Circadian clock protein KaiB n=1 Tax=Taibaiella lutea TaxID=2608001 RepID=A0A5M6CK30_9BACT|nr:circadian clock KaiB family protein [Taibaiella lutea]KAA5534790.1 circadian clock protein KaiB [Taibaiella lutea]
MTEGDLLTAMPENEDEQKYVLRLFVTGASPVSVRAINNLKVILEKHLNDNYELEIIDVHQQPLMVKDEDITAVPMLLKKFPLPFRRLVGDMSDYEKVLRGLGLK